MKKQELSQKEIKVLNVITQYGVDIKKNGVEDFIGQTLNHLVPFMEEFNSNIAYYTRLTEDERKSLMDNWERASLELKKSMDNIKPKGAK